MQVDTPHRVVEVVVAEGRSGRTGRVVLWWCMRMLELIRWGRLAVRSLLLLVLRVQLRRVLVKWWPWLLMLLSVAWVDPR